MDERESLQSMKPEDDDHFVAELENIGKPRKVSSAHQLFPGSVESSLLLGSKVKNQFDMLDGLRKRSMKKHRKQERPIERADVRSFMQKQLTGKKE